MNRARVWLWLAAFLLALMLAPGFHSYETPDFATVNEVVHTGHLGLTTGPLTNFYPAPDGRFYEVHDLGTLIAAVPVAVAARHAADLVGWPFKRVFELWWGVFGCALFATTFVTLLAVLRQLGVRPETRVWPLFALLLSSQYLAYTVSPSDLALATPFVAGAIYAWLAAESGRTSGWLWSGLLLGFALLIKISLATIAVTVLLRCVFVGYRNAGLRRTFQTASLFSAGLLPAFIGTAWWNHLRTGGYLTAPYPEWIHGFRIEYLPFGLAEALISPNKGLLVYTPVLLLVAWTARRGGALRRVPAFAFVVGVSFLCTFVRLSGSIAASSWGGWGDRYYIPWVALLLVPIAADWERIRPRAFALVLIAAGMLLNAGALVTNWHYRQSLCGVESWTWHGTNACAVAALPANIARTLGASIPDVVLPQASAANVFISNRLTFWWYGARTFGVAPWASWLIGLSIGVALAVCLWRARTALRAA